MQSFEYTEINKYDLAIVVINVLYIVLQDSARAKKSLSEYQRLFPNKEIILRAESFSMIKFYGNADTTILVRKTLPNPVKWTVFRIS